ncbi:DNA polymerase III subunit gamma/tau [Candidatus Gracilibacteria bacterium]|nr:DNA polymerase III subunit gamma/tau [Candidatus Gracilibacteria bacterium]
MSLYTKYRPRDWDSVIGQDAISTVLRTSLIQGRVGHAYILTGSRGTGKTTTARILAKGVNCLDLQNGNPCHICAHCIAFDQGNMLDCIEIDAASHTGVDHIRDLIEKARFEPNQGKYKVYIIDEVHMLSTPSFNALLKTLEEPPKHVKFILATTEIDKVLETIRSRSLRFDFKKISEADIVKRLEYVCGQEGIRAEQEALEIIAQAARGALRDALTLTEQSTVNSEISTDYVRSTLSLIEDSLIEEIIETIVTADKVRMMTILDTLRSRHAEVRGLFDQILYGLRDAMMSSFLGKNNTANFAEYSEIFAIFESAYSRIRSIADGGLLIEITLLRAVARGEKSATKEENQKIGRSLQDEKNLQAQENNVTPSTQVESKKKKEEKDKIELAEQISTQGVVMPTEGPKNISSSNFNYIHLLEEIKKTKSTLVLDLKTARFEHTKNSLTLIFSKEWHYNRANTPAMRNIVIETLGNLYSNSWSVVCRLEGMPGVSIADVVF